MKYLYRNIDNTIIDIVDDVKPVRINENRITITCYPDKAQGFMGTNEKIYPKIGTNLIPTFEDVKDWIGVEEIPEYVRPRIYKYEDGEFTEAEGYELSAGELTTSTLQQRADIDYIAMETGVDI